MAEAVVEIEGVGKRYAIAHKQRRGTRTLRDEIAHGIRTAGRRLLRQDGSAATTREEFWALRELSFSVRQGELLGIVGRNGAGKSTLLKLLSRITEPTTGRITVTGRLASLLEVGTGFHSELTGRENIFLNGAILGMSKAEIRRKFDEIVAFSEVDRFLDTPVKRYSSGMYVRLAFAVAAHLEPEILIVDEVLAVGDAAFQKKCIGKMQDVTRAEGRTVLFVSHNMDTIQRLCTRCIMLDGGQLVADGSPDTTILRYISDNASLALPNRWVDLSAAKRQGSGEARFTAIRYSSRSEEVQDQPWSTGPLEFSLTIESDRPRSVASLAVTIYDKKGTMLVNADIGSVGEVAQLQRGRNFVKLRIEHLYLNPETYTIGLWLDSTARSSGPVPLDHIETACEIEVVGVKSSELGIKERAPVICPFRLLEVSQEIPG
jgi:lipopolysaccharide transport system ATP-binding protein